LQSIAQSPVEACVPPSLPGSLPVADVLSLIVNRLSASVRALSVEDENDALGIEDEIGPLGFEDEIGVLVFGSKKSAPLRTATSNTVPTTARLRQGRLAHIKAD
jgi:hypothetical protein